MLIVNVRSENLVLDQLIIPKLIFFSILITNLLDIVLILLGEILSWSLMRVEGLKPCEFHFTCCRLTNFKNNFSINNKRDEILYISRKLN